MDNTKEWHADITITDELVRHCLLAQFPNLAPINSIKHIGEGWDNKVFLIHDDIIFRFPRRKVAVELMEHENAVLPKLANRLKTDLHFPVPQYIGRPSSDYPYPFQGYRRIPGLSAYQAHLSEKEQLATLRVMKASI